MSPPKFTISICVLSDWPPPIFSKIEKCLLNWSAFSCLHGVLKFRILWDAWAKDFSVERPSIIGNSMSLKCKSWSLILKVTLLFSLYVLDKMFYVCDQKFPFVTNKYLRDFSIWKKKSRLIWVNFLAIILQSNNIFRKWIRENGLAISKFHLNNSFDVQTVSKISLHLHCIRIQWKHYHKKDIHKYKLLQNIFF